MPADARRVEGLVFEAPKPSTGEAIRSLFDRQKARKKAKNARERKTGQSLFSK